MFDITVGMLNAIVYIQEDINKETYMKIKIKQLESNGKFVITLLSSRFNWIEFNSRQEALEYLYINYRLRQVA